MSRPTQDPPVRRNAYGAFTLFGCASQHIRRHCGHVGVRLPRHVNMTVWAVPLSLATTRGILSFPRATQMFHFARFPALSRSPRMTAVGFPHSDIDTFRGYTRLGIAFRSVSRLSSALDA